MKKKFYYSHNAPVMYTLEYSANGGTGSIIDSQSPYSAGSTVTVLFESGISKSGYTFAGWNTKADGSGIPYTPDDKFHITENITLYAQWGIDQYNIITVANPSEWGTTTGGGLYSNGATTQIQAIPNTGYEFMEWREGDVTTNPRTITVTKNATYNAIFYKIPTGELRIVDNALNLYTYDEYANLVNPPAAIGVAINEGNDWLVYYKEYIGYRQGTVKFYALGQKHGSEASLPGNIFKPFAVSDLMYPHSGVQSSNLYKNYYGSGFAAYEAGQLSDGQLFWYIPNLYETSQIFTNAFDSYTGANNSFNSHFVLANCDQIIITTSTTDQHAHWTSDIGYGSGAGSSGKITPYRVFVTNNNNNFVYRSSGDYTFYYNYNFVRPVARFYADYVRITYNNNGADGGDVPTDNIIYKGDLAVISSINNLYKTGYSFNGWNTSDDGSGIQYNGGATLHLHTNLTLYAQWV